MVTRLDTLGLIFFALTPKVLRTIFLLSGIDNLFHSIEPLDPKGYPPVDIKVFMLDCEGKEPKPNRVVVLEIVSCFARS